MRMRALDEIRTSGRRLPRASARISSERPVEYMFDVSNRLMPASRQVATSLRASSTPWFPAAENIPSPPNVKVPMDSTDTLRPDLPRVRYFIIIPLLLRDEPEDYFKPTARVFR